MSLLTSHTVEGHVSCGYEGVRDAFVENFVRRRELGGACCIFRHGEKVVDLWGGIRNKRTGELWAPDTMVVVHSATKGLAAMTLAIAHSRGWLDFEERVCAYWPEFAQKGKERVTVRQLLAHQAGLFALDEPVDRSVVADLDRLAVVLARQKPAWDPASVSRSHPRLLRRRAAAPRRSLASQSRTVLPGGDGVTPRRGGLHSVAGGHPELAPGRTGPAHLLRGASRLRASIHVASNEPPLQHLPGAEHEPWLAGIPGRAADLCTESRGAVRRRRRHGTRHRACV